MGDRSILDDEVVSSWLASLDVAQTTKSSYEAGFRRFLAWCEACGLDFDELEQDDVVAFKADLERTGRLSPATVSLALSAVRSFYRWSASRQNIAGSTAKGKERRRNDGAIYRA